VHDATLRLGLQRKFLCHARRVFIEITPQVLVLQHYFVGIPQVSNAPCRMYLAKRTTTIRLPLFIIMRKPIVETLVRHRRHPIKVTHLMAL
jgi:hypothetical protein